MLDVTEMFWRCSAVAAEAASLARPPLSCHLDLAFVLMLKDAVLLSILKVVDDSVSELLRPQKFDLRSPWNLYIDLQSVFSGPSQGFEDDLMINSPG